MHIPCRCLICPQPAKLFSLRKCALGREGRLSAWVVYGTILTVFWVILVCSTLSSTYTKIVLFVKQFQKNDFFGITSIAIMALLGRCRFCSQARHMEASYTAYVGFKMVVAIVLVCPSVPPTHASEGT